MRGNNLAGCSCPGIPLESKGGTVLLTEIYYDAIRDDYFPLISQANKMANH